MGTQDIHGYTGYMGVYMIKNHDLNLYVSRDRLSQGVPKLPYLGEHSEVSQAWSFTGYTVLLGQTWVHRIYMVIQGIQYY